jgi:energy-coupling factor transporter ATP-binding protein EcfA2
MAFTFEIKGPTGSKAFELAEGMSAFIVGANGSGKTRLAVQVEDMLGNTAHRISAHRKLTLNPDVPKISQVLAENALRYGHGAIDAAVRNRIGSRYGQKAATHLLSDFDALIQTLYAEQSNTALDTHERHRAGETEIRAKPTRFEILRTTWDRLLPHRKLLVTGDDIEVEVVGNSQKYSASDMSDGERSTFYLLGQVLG